MFNNIEVDILVNGRPIRKYPHQGKIFIESKHWTEYSIRIRNNNFVRKLAIVSVDGINVVDGQPAGKSQAGYILHGSSSYEVKGFRTSNSEVHPFKFNRKERSYAAKSEATQGDTTNCGVIGIEIYDEAVKPTPIVIREPIVIKEYPRPWPWEWPKTTWYVDNTYANSAGTYRDSTMSYTCSVGEGPTRGVADNRQSELVACACAPAPTDEPVMDMNCFSFAEKTRGFDTGTEFSKRAVTDVVQEVAFETGALSTTIVIFYASYEALKEMGVSLTKEPQVTFPNPFPTKFCKPPIR